MTSLKIHDDSSHTPLNQGLFQLFNNHGSVYFFIETAPEEMRTFKELKKQFDFRF